MQDDFRNAIEKMSKTIITTGAGFRKPSDGSVCTVILNALIGKKCGSYLTGLPVDSPSTITIGFADAPVDKLIDYCVCTMLVNEHSRFSITLNDALVEFEVRLSECFFKPYVFLMSDSEKLCLSEIFKRQGTALFIKKEVAKAFEKFHRALQYLLTLNAQYPAAVTSEDSFLSVEDMKTTKQLFVNLLNNIALCHLRLENINSVIPVCARSLDVAPNIKAYYRRALAYMHNKDYEKAEEDLLSAHEIDKNDKDVLEKLTIVRQLGKPSQEIYKETIKKMFLHDR